MPPHTIISMPVQIDVGSDRAPGALAVLVALQELVAGLYRPPVFKSLPLFPPYTIISLPLQIAVCASRPMGALTVLLAVQIFVPGLYLPPVFK